MHTLCRDDDDCVMKRGMARGCVSLISVGCMFGCDGADGADGADGGEGGGVECIGR